MYSQCSGLAVSHQRTIPENFSISISTVYVGPHEYFGNEGRASRRGREYLVDKVVHQQVVLYNSSLQLLVVHHILKWEKGHNA